MSRVMIHAPACRYVQHSRAGPRVRCLWCLVESGAAGSSMATPVKASHNVPRWCTPGMPNVQKSVVKGFLTARLETRTKESAACARVKSSKDAIELVVKAKKGQLTQSLITAVTTPWSATATGTLSMRRGFE